MLDLHIDEADSAVQKKSQWWRIITVIGVTNFLPNPLEIHGLDLPSRPSWDPMLRINQNCLVLPVFTRAKVW